MRVLAAVLLLVVLKPAGTLPADTGGKPAALAREALRGRRQRDDIPGLSAAVAVRGRIVWSEAFGLADRETGAPATPATRFGIGSITKSLTMALASRLVDEGKLDLDAPVERYLQGFPYPGRGITVRLVAGRASGSGSGRRPGPAWAGRSARTTKGAGSCTSPAAVPASPPGS